MRRFLPVSLVSLLFVCVLASPAAADDPRADAKPEKKLVGVIAELSPTSITVRGEDASLTCALPKGAAARLARFSVGDRVKLVCKTRGGHLVASTLARLRTQPPKAARELHLVGVVTELAPAAITVRSEAGMLRCSIPTALAGKLRVAVGDRVKLVCKAAEGRTELRAVERLAAESRAAEYVEYRAKGVVSALSTTSISVLAAGETLACSFAEKQAAKLGGLRVGDRVKLGCARTERGLELSYVERRDDTSEGVELKAHGTVIAVTREAVTLRVGDGRLSCALPAKAGAQLERLAVGARLKIVCTLTAGRFELTYAEPVAAR